MVTTRGPMALWDFENVREELKMQKRGQKGWLQCPPVVHKGVEWSPQTMAVLLEGQSPFTRERAARVQVDVHCPESSQVVTQNSNFLTFETVHNLLLNLIL